MKGKFSFNAKKIALIAVMTATIEGAKLALAALPNVEAVTLLCAAYGYVFGGCGVVATTIFVVIEGLIYGVNSWMLSYVIHWNAVCLIFWILGRKQVKNRIILTATAVLLTVWFGVLTSLVDIGLFSGTFDNFAARFAIYYTRGAVFYIIQTVCNLIVFPIAFLPLVGVLKKCRNKFLYDKNKGEIIDKTGEKA